MGLLSRLFGKLDSIDNANLPDEQRQALTAAEVRKYVRSNYLGSDTATVQDHDNLCDAAAKKLKGAKGR